MKKYIDSFGVLEWCFLAALTLLLVHLCSEWLVNAWLWTVYVLTEIALNRMAGVWANLAVVAILILFCLRLSIRHLILSVKDATREKKRRNLKRLAMMESKARREAIQNAKAARSRRLY